MGRFAVLLTFVGIVLVGGLTAGSTQAGRLAAPGPNPSWTDMQKFEWYLGYLARAGQVCGSYKEAETLRGLARMSPYGDLGLKTVTGDGFGGTACAKINNKVKELAADAERIRAYIEATYNCRGNACAGQRLGSWRDHACGEKLAEHFASRSVPEKQISEVTITDVRNSGATLDYHARVRFNDCQGSFYVEMKDSCRVEKDYTRGDCTIEGVPGY